MLHFSNLLLSLLASMGPLGQEAQVGVQPSQGPAESDQELPFPPSTALAEGVAPEALLKLDELVAGFVAADEVVGAELLVIKNGRSILHEAYGWRDRERGQKMETNSVFCVRSMTKPLIAASILMLVDEGLIELDERASAHLPFLDAGGTAEFTIEQLLQHTSGLPMSLLLGKDLRELEGIQEVAELGVGHELSFAPGKAFQYSDQGTDTLTALLEAVSGMPAAEFIQERLLDPLGMDSSTCVMEQDDPLRARGCSKYAGSKGAWNRFWSTEEAPLFPFFLGSQGLYSSLSDYARFLEFWKRKGKVGRERLLGARFVRRALSPGPYPGIGPTGLPGLRADYGYLMQLWSGPGEAAAGDRRELVAFGHTGSDGTHAWCFPEANAMVLYFTQSRGTTSGLQLEEVLGELFLGVSFDANQAAPPFEEYLGYYRTGPGDLYRAVIQDGPDLGLEILGRGVVPLSYLGEDRWKMRPNPSVVLQFERDRTGRVSGYRIGDQREHRFQPAGDLPSIEEITERVSAAYGLKLLKERGPLYMTSEVQIEKLKLEGSAQGWYEWPDRYREDSSFNDVRERVSFDGHSVWYDSTTRPRAALEGASAAQLKTQSPVLRFGHWRQAFPGLHVVQRLEEDDREVFLLRTGDTSAIATTFYVDWERGLVVREDGWTYLDQTQRTAKRVIYSDHREISGLQLPFRTEVQLANPWVGSVTSTVTDVELEAELPSGGFQLE